MNKKCRHIEPLLYLYRKGELGFNEQTAVKEHIAGCPDCRQILADLQSMDSALAPVRSETPELASGKGVAAEVISEVSRTRRAFPSFGISIEYFRWVRPTLGFALLTLAVLFLVQEYGDAVKVSELEQRLHLEVSVTGSAQINLAGIQNLLGRLSSTGMQASVDPLNLVSTALPRLFGERRLLFDEMSKKYPGLSGISLHGDLNDREKAILATEGKAFINDIEHLVREGGK